MMKFIADENIPLEVIEKLKELSIDIVSLSQIKPGIEDEEVLSISQRQKRVLITFDDDFGKLIFKNQLENFGVILLRIVPQKIDYIYLLLKKVLLTNIDFENSFCVIEPNRIRAIKIKE